jgi:Cys-rich repeat protein
MKTDEDNCWYSGRHEFCKETYPGQYEWCSAKYHRCVECTDDSHCPPERPWCDWDMDCEECLVSAHCPTGESCIMRSGSWVCRRKDCVDYREEGDYEYCANNFKDTPICDLNKRTCVECIHPSDCEGILPIAKARERRA